MRIERHVFGSYSGYTTMSKSPGVSTEDCRTLEAGAYGFGQCNDRAFAKGLGKAPAYFTRLLGGGRRGLTRILEGKVDDNNRPTLRLITVILTQRDWDSQLWGDVTPLLENANLWAWDGKPDLPVLEFDPKLAARNIARKSVPKLLALLSEVERNFAARKGISVAVDDYGQAEMRAIEMLIPMAARRQFVSSFRSLSAQMPVSVNCIASESGAHPTFRYQPENNHLSAYAQFLSTTDLMAGQIPVEQVAVYKSFGAIAAVPDGREPAAPQGAPQVAIARPRSGLWPLVITAAVAVVAVIGAFFAGGAIATRQESERAKSHYDVVMAQASAELSGSYEDKLQAALDVDKGSYDDMLAAIQKKLTSAQDAAKAAAKAASSPAPSKEDAGLREERDAFRAAYEALAKHESGQFTRVNESLHALVKRIRPRTIGELQAECAYIR